MSSYLRARRPLNLDAVEAANAAVTPRTGGRPLTLETSDAELRNEWMKAYIKAGGKVERVDSNAPADETKPTKDCPCAPIQSIHLESVEFLSDHGLIKDEETAWTNTGILYRTPEWSASGNKSPLTHTMDKPISVRVTLRVEPPGACPETGVLSGISDDGLEFLKEGVTFKGGPVIVELTSKNSLPEAVDQFVLMIEWKAQAEAANGMGTSQNDLYVTMDTPIDAGRDTHGVTVKRMAKAVELVMQADSLNPHHIVEYLMSLLPAYTLVTSPDVPADHHHPPYSRNKTGGAWPIADYLVEAAECQAIVRFVIKVLYQVGCPGEAKNMLVWTDPDIGGGATVLEKEYGGKTLHGRHRDVNGERWYVALAADDAPVGASFSAKSSVMNMYEACLRFRHGGITYYYGGGAGRYNSKDEVIHAFRALVWYAPILDDAGNTNYVVREVVQTY